MNGDTTRSTGRDVAIVTVSQTPSVAAFDGPEPVLVMRCVNDILNQTGLERSEVDFTIAGSCDYNSGLPFAFVMNLDGIGAWPPVYESHVEMDGAWALFEAWLRLQVGDVDTALVIGSGRPSPGNHREAFALQTDPYFMAPLGLDPTSLAGLQARALLDRELATERDFAEVVVRSRQAGASNPKAMVTEQASVEELMAQPYVASPLRAHDVAPTADGAAAVLLVAGDRARELRERPAWIRGIDHRIESHHPGFRDLTDSPSIRTAAAHAGAADGPIDVAELMVVHSHEELIVRRSLGLGEQTVVNPSGGPLAGDPVMATGLVRVAEVASRIMDGTVRRGVAHASSGACLQQNLVSVLEGDD